MTAASAARRPGQPQIGTKIKIVVPDEDLAAADRLVAIGWAKTRSAALRMFITAGRLAFDEQARELMSSDK